VLSLSNDIEYTTNVLICQYLFKTFFNFFENFFRSVFV
jgi:hypothetical protein